MAVDIHVEVPQGGACVSVSRGETVGGVSCGGEYVTALPSHPRPGHTVRGRAPPVLPAAWSPLVSEELRLPDGADRSVVHHGTGSVPGAAAPFVHVLWCTPETLDERTGGEDGDGGGTADALRAVSACVQVEGRTHGGTLVQPAGGLYREVGWGVLSGVGRSTLEAGGHSSIVPFRRNPELSARLAPALSSVFSRCASLAHAHLPPASLQSHLEPWTACPPDIAHALQYPPLVPGARPLLSHQVALRGVDETPQGCLEAVPDLHTDIGDGGGALGTVAIYFCDACPPQLLQQALVALSYRDLVVFPNADGGRGVRVQVLRPGWVCVVLLRTSSCLHGGVAADTAAANLTLPPEMGRPVRVITYPMRAIETLMRNLQDDAVAADVLRDLLGLPHISPEPGM